MEDEEKRVRGTVERSYRVRKEEAVVDPAARAAMTRDDHRRAFTTFAASLMGDFDRYSAQRVVSLVVVPDKPEAG